MMCDITCSNKPDAFANESRIDNADWRHTFMMQPMPPAAMNCKSVYHWRSSVPPAITACWRAVPNMPYILSVWVFVEKISYIR